MRRDERVVHELVVRRRSADQQVVAVVGNAVQLVKAAQVDKHVGVGEPQPQQRQQALSARDDLGILTTLGECSDRLVGGGWLDVFELGRNHAAPPLLLALLRAASIVRQTRSGLHGIVTSLTPSGRSASTTAFTTAGVDAIVPASPTPFTPSRVCAGVSVRSVT